MGTRFRYIIFSFLSAAGAWIHTQAQTTISGSFVHGGINRTYSFYVPATYNPATPVPLVIGLHGLSSSGSDFAQYRDFRPIADTANFIMAHPDGSTLLGIKFWNYGNVLGSTVDDVGFIEALIDTISAHYNINAQRVYSVGMSNGSFMSYYLACQSNRFAAIGGVTGSMSVNMYNTCNPQRPTPIIHVHGTQDNTNPYEGTSSMVGIEQLIQFWVNQNACNPIPTQHPIPDIQANDDATAIRYEYTGGSNGNTVELFKVIGGGHSWPNCPMPNSNEVTCMDFDTRLEIWRFFSMYEISSTTALENQQNIPVNIWPNPAQDVIFFQMPENPITRVSLFDMHGREIERIENENIYQMNISHISSGIYILKIVGTHFNTFQKIVIER